MPDTIMCSPYLESVSRSKPQALATLTLALFLTLTSCTKRLVPTSTGALVVCEVKSSAVMDKGYGINLVLMNRSMGKTYRTVTRGPLSPISYVSALPTGSYFIVEARLPIGGVEFSNTTKEMVEYFGILEVESGRAYYLGSLEGKKTLGARNTVSLVTVDSLPSAKLIEVLAKDGNALRRENFEYIGPVLNEELLVY